MRYKLQRPLALLTTVWLWACTTEVSQTQPPDAGTATVCGHAMQGGGAEWGEHEAPGGESSAARLNRAATWLNRATNIHDIARSHVAPARAR